jgi:O-methyltransferase
MRGSPSMWDAFTDLAHAARTGKPARDWATLVSHLAAHPDEAAIFDAAMVAKSLRVIPAVLDAYDFSRFAVVADIGGGQGHLLRAILARHAAAAGVLFDVPHVIEHALDAAGTRIELVAGDFFADDLPAADCYVLMDLLHDWSDRDAAAILAAVRRAAPAHARLVIVETLVPESPDPHFGKTLDLIMLAVTGGRERTSSQHGALLAGAGFRLLRVVATAAQYSIIEAGAT